MAQNLALSRANSTDANAQMNNENQDINDIAYSAYASWKHWQGEHDLAIMGERYAQELQRAGLPPASRILEVGFGNGDFLSWARQAGYRITGIEINPAFVASARLQGFDVQQGDIASLNFETQKFDAIVALDVLEHLTKPEILEHLRTYNNLLAPDGVVIARFPNAASPFGIWAQVGDITHQTGLTSDTMVQFGLLSGFTMIYGGNAARSYRGGKRKGLAIIKRLTYMIRDLMEIFFGYLYFGQRVPLDMNMTVIMKRTEP